MDLCTLCEIWRGRFETRPFFRNLTPKKIILDTLWSLGDKIFKRGKFQKVAAKSHPKRTGPVAQYDPVTQTGDPPICRVYSVGGLHQPELERPTGTTGAALCCLRNISSNNFGIIIKIEIEDF